MNVEKRSFLKRRTIFSEAIESKDIRNHVATDPIPTIPPYIPLFHIFLRINST
jgi:hypothetical protein